MNTLFKTITCPNNDDANIIDLNTEKSHTQSIHINDLELEMHIGVSEEEQQNKQRVIINAEFETNIDQKWREDEIGNVVSYIDIISMIKEMTEKEPIHLVETVAYKIIDMCFQFSPKIKSAKVTVDKPDIIKDADSVGCTIFKKRSA